MQKLLRSILAAAIATTSMAAQAGDVALANRYSDCAAIFGVMALALDHTGAKPPTTQQQQADTVRQYKAQTQFFLTKAVEQAPQNIVVARFTSSSQQYLEQMKKDSNINNLWAASAPCRAQQAAPDTTTPQKQ